MSPTDLLPPPCLRTIRRLHATSTCDAIAVDSVTVNSTSPPSETFADGPLMYRSALSSSLGSSLSPFRSLRVIVAELTVRPTTVVVVPGMMMVS